MQISSTRILTGSLTIEIKETYSIMTFKLGQFSDTVIGSLIDFDTSFDWLISCYGDAKTSLLLHYDSYVQCINRVRAYLLDQKSDFKLVDLEFFPEENIYCELHFLY